MLDCFISAAWLFAACGVTVPAQLDSASHRLAPIMSDTVFISASLSHASALTASRDHRNAKIEWIDGDGHKVACPVVERFGVEIRGSLIRHALRKIGKIRGVVGAKDSAKLVTHGKQIIVIPEIWQELLRRGIRRNRRKH